MDKIKIEYVKLKDQLINIGEENTPDEVMWNDGILTAIDELFLGVKEDVKRLIMLNLI